MKEDRPALRTQVQQKPNRVKEWLASYIPVNAQKASQTSRSLTSTNDDKYAPTAFRRVVLAPSEIEARCNQVEIENQDQKSKLKSRSKSKDRRKRKNPATLFTQPAPLIPQFSLFSKRRICKLATVSDFLRVYIYTKEDI